MEKRAEYATKMKKVVERNYFLYGLVLVMRMVTKFFDEKYLVHPETHEPYRLVDKKLVTTNREETQFPLKKVSAKKLAEYRMAEIPSFVLKTEDGLFHTEVPKDVNLVSSKLLGEHKCGNCHRLSDAGCLKVRERSTGIERYPWIPLGYETFATAHDCFVVAKCLRWQKCPPYRKPTAEQMAKARLFLAQYVWPEVSSIKDIDEHIRENHERDVRAANRK